MLLCSDGFRKELMPEEIRGFLQSDRHMAENILQKRLQKALETCRLRGEKDNVSAMVIGW
jgi:serine/threonine protein phosphatase PrpC